METVWDERVSRRTQKLFKGAVATRLSGLVHIFSYLMEYRHCYRANKTLRLIIFALWQILMQRLHDSAREHILEINGYKLKTIANDMGISVELLVFGTHEPLTTRLLQKEITEGMVCIDVSGNIGYYAILESKLVGKDGYVIVFEPLQRTYAHLLSNIEQNNISNIKAYNIAAGSSNGHANFFVTDCSNLCRVVNDVKLGKKKFSSYRDRVDIMKLPKVIDIIRVPLVTLDDFIDKNQLRRVDLVRMDVEGYEYEIYQGMTRTVSKFRPKILVEIHYFDMGTDKTINLLGKMYEDGYEVKWCIMRHLDFAFIGNPRDVNFNITLAEIVELVRSKKLHPVGSLQLLLESRQ